LTQAGFSDVSPCWSPDGTEIAFVRSGPYLPSIYTIAIAEGVEVGLTLDLGIAGNPDWSPDGDFIAFELDPMKPVGEPSNYDIYLIPSLGGESTRITDDAGQDLEPDWSPDCTRIVFSSDRGGNWDIWMIEAGSVSSTADLTWGKIKASFR